MKKTKVLLITVVMIAVLMLAMMLTVGAETPISQIDQQKIDAGYVARVGDDMSDASYFKTLKEAIYAVEEADTTVYLLKDYKQTESIKSVKNLAGAVAVNYTLEAINPDVVLTVGCSWLFDLGAGSNVIPTLKNIKIDVGGKNLGYFNGVTLNIGEGAHIYGKGTNADKGLIYGYNGATFNVDGATFEALGTNPVFVVAADDGKTPKPSSLTVTTCTSNGAGFVTAKGGSKVVINGGEFNFTSGEGARAFYMNGASTELEINGGTINASNAKSNNVICSDGKFTMTDGKISVSAAGNNPIRVSGVAIISGGTFRENSNSNGLIYVTAAGQLTVVDGLFYSTYGSLLQTGDGTDGGPFVNVHGGVFALNNTRTKDEGGNVNMLKHGAGTLNILGGIFTATAAANNPIRVAGSVANIAGGTFQNTTGQALIYALDNAIVQVEDISYDGSKGAFLYAGDGSTKATVYIVDSTITGACTWKTNAEIYLLGKTSYPGAQGRGVYATQEIIDAEDRDVAIIEGLNRTSKGVGLTRASGAEEYYTVYSHCYNLSGAVYSVTNGNNKVILLKDYTQLSALPRNEVKSYTLTSKNGAVLTVGCSYLFDLGAKSTVVPTITDIEIVIPKGKNLGYFNEVSIIIDAGAYIHGQGKAASEGMILGYSKANITVKEGAKIVAENTNFPIFAVKDGSFLDIQGGTLIHTGAYTGTEEYAMFRTYNGSTKTKITGNTTIVMDVNAQNARGFMFWRLAGGLWIEGENVALVARNDNYLFENGYQDAAAFGTNKLYVRGAYLSTDRADGVIIGDDAAIGYVDISNVAIDNDVTATLLNGRELDGANNTITYYFHTRISAETRTVVIPATMNGAEVVKVVREGYSYDFDTVRKAVESGVTIYILHDMTISKTVSISRDTRISAGTKGDGTRCKIIVKSGPAFKVSYGTLMLENIDVECNALFAQTYGTVILGEGAMINVNANDRFVYVYQGGTLCLDGAIVNVEYTKDNIIRCDNGTVVINDGEIIAQNVGNDVIRMRGDFVMNGGKIVSDSAAKNMIYLVDENNTPSTVTINGGTIISNNYDTIYAVGGVVIFNAGTVVQHAGSIARIETKARVFVNGGVFVADRDSSAAAGNPRSMYLFYKNGASASATVTGGVYLLYERDYIYYSTTAGESQPNVVFLKNENSFVGFGDGEYYFMAFHDQLGAVPVLSDRVVLNESTYGVKFTAEVSAEMRDAIEAWAASIAGEDVAYTLTYGMLIASVDDILAAKGFSPDLFDALGIDYINVQAENVAETGAFIYTAEKSDFTEAEYGVLYTAMPYVIVTVDGVDTIVYASYQTDISASVSYLATKLLREVTDIKTGAYQYASIAVNAAYSRFTQEQQLALKALIAHVHTNDYKGVCTVCQYDSVIDLGVDTTTKIYTKYDNEYAYRLVLSKGVQYKFEMTKNVAKLALYDAEGNRCALVDDLFTCAVDGVYYLKATAALVGKAELSVSHVHVRDYMGNCSVPSCNNPCALDDEVVVDEAKEVMVKKDEKYYYAVELVGGIQYQILSINGQLEMNGKQYVIYDANGTPMPVVNSVFTCDEDGDGTYYIVVEALVSAMGNIHVKHIHAYDEIGDCVMVGCESSINIAFEDVYEKQNVTLEANNNNYFTIDLFEGNKYFVKSEGDVGLWTVYAPSGETVELGTKGDFIATEDGTYRLVLEAQVTQSSTVWFEIEHTCDYGYTGICSICSEKAKDAVLTLTDGKLQRKTIKKNVLYYYSVSGMVDGATYTINVPAAINVVAYGVNADLPVELIVADGKLVWSKENGSVLYMILSAEEDIASAELKVEHEHVINFKGACEVAGCALSKKIYATVDNAVKVQYKSGETHYYFVEWPDAGETYKVVLNKAEADVVVYKPNGEIVELDENGCFVGGKMCYYIVVTATADAESDATFAFTTVE